MVTLGENLEDAGGKVGERSVWEIRRNATDEIKKTKKEGKEEKLLRDVQCRTN